MTERITGALLVGMGAVLALGYLLFRADLERAARTGPRWKRRLVGAGIVALTVLGIVSCREPGPTVTCYEVSVLPDARAGAGRLAQQTGLLNGLLARGELTTDTATTVMATIRQDLAALGDPAAVAALSDTELAQAKADAVAARAALAAAEARLAARGALDRNEVWRELNEDWREAEEIAAGKRGPYPFTQAEKERLVARLNDGTARLDELAAAGLLTAAEAGLLRRNVADRLDQVNGFRPTEMQMATCYEPMMMDPQRESYERVSARLALLKELVAGGTVHPAAAAQIVPTLEQDLKFLATAQPPRWSRTTPEEQARMAATRREAERALAELQQLLAAPPREP